MQGRFVSRILCGIMLVFCCCLEAGQGNNGKKDFVVSKLFADHMVFQQNAKLPVWGWAVPGTKVSVKLAGNSSSAVAGKDGKWMAWLPPLKAGGPYELVIDGPEKISVKDVLIGDVWICSGQSNMEMPVRNCMNKEKEYAAANYPSIRQFGNTKLIAYEPQKDTRGRWSVCTPKNVPHWTAVGYFFGRDLYNKLHIPIGLINVSWGGTRVEAWTSREVAEKWPRVKNEFDRLQYVKENRKKLLSGISKQKKDYANARKKIAVLEKDKASQKKYAAPGFDDSNWKTLIGTRDYDEQGFKGYHGICWYRKTVDIPAAWAGKDLLLSPGAVDEIETTYFNGEKVGSRGSFEPMVTKYWNQSRVYKIPGAKVKAGKAVIAVRVINVFGQGGLSSNHDAADMYLRPADASAGRKISLAGKWKFDFVYNLPPKAYREHPKITNLFNGMINPLIPFPVKGAIWYQGESNAGNAYEYRVRFADMIRDWRTRWNDEFPFYWVQLANFQSPKKKPGVDNWAVVRESQDATLKLPKTGTALAIDIGEAGDIHPKNKQEVGRRLALVARAKLYGEKDLVYSGPRYKSMQKSGNKIILSFDHIGGGLVAKGGKLNRFAIAGADRKFVWADAVINGNNVVVSSAKVKEPVAVRYAYEINPEGCNLYNKAGLPASPFRTDNWPVPTQK